jgi:hypothetical protein
VGSILPFEPRVVFDDADTRIMGEAFDAACREIRGSGQPPCVREVMAKRIIDAARRRAGRNPAARRGAIRVEWLTRRI